MDTHGYTDGSGVGSYPTKINSALTSAFPKAIDIESDIIKQGLVDTYLRELKSALRTRGLMDIIEQREPSIDEVISANRGISTNDAQNILDNMLATRQRQTANLADILSQVLVWSSMRQSDKDEFNRLISDGNGIDVYARILAHTDLKTGKAQDKIRVAYTKVSVAAASSPTALITAIESKWWLHKMNTLYSLDTPDGVREGIRAVLTMLLEGPPTVAINAGQALTSIETTDFGDGDQYWQSYVQMLHRHGGTLIKTAGGEGSLMQLSSRIASLESGGGGKNKDNRNNDGGGGNGKKTPGCKENGCDL